MGIANSHQISRYYDFFRDKEIVFTKANVQILKMDPRQIYVKCAGGQWPCLINSSSLQSAKISYCFVDANNAPIRFFVKCAVGDINKYQNTEELAVVTLNFTQRPPDDLIFKIGEFLEANENFYHRKEERIDINKNSIRKLGLEKEESVIFVENVPRRCILKDLSFSGAKVMLVGVPKFLVGKNIALKIDFIDTNESVLVPGIIPRAEFLEGRKDIASVHIAFNGDSVPMVYKIHINSFITTYQKTILNNQNSQGAINQPVINTASETKSQPVVDTITRNNPQEQASAQTNAQPQVQAQPAQNPTA